MTDPSRHLTMLLVRIWALVLTKDGSMILDGQRRTGLLSVHRFLGARSRAEPPNRNILGQALRDDKASGFSGRLYGMTVFGSPENDNSPLMLCVVFLLHVI